MHRKLGSKFMADLEPFFSKIRNLHQNITTIMQHTNVEKIRIAVLDSGVQCTDSVIACAINHKRINVGKSRSFLGPTDNWQEDTEGHGTNITQLLLTTAPTAEIYVGKICTKNLINDVFMPGIASVSLRL